MRSHASRLMLMENELCKFSRDCIAIASCLEREINAGKCIRQSSESKQSRIDILRIHSEWANDLIKKLSNK